MAIGIVFLGMVVGLISAIAALGIGAPILAALLAYCLGGTVAVGLLIVVQLTRQSELRPSLDTITVKPTRN